MSLAGSAEPSARVVGAVQFNLTAYVTTAGAGAGAAELALELLLAGVLLELLVAGVELLLLLVLLLVAAPLDTLPVPVDDEAGADKLPPPPPPPPQAVTRVVTQMSAIQLRSDRSSMILFLFLQGRKIAEVAL